MLLLLTLAKCIVLLSIVFDKTIHYITILFLLLIILPELGPVLVIKPMAIVPLSISILHYREQFVTQNVGNSNSSLFSFCCILASPRLPWLSSHNY